MKNLTITLLVAIFTFSSLQSQILYVKDGAIGNGYSWENAMGSLHKALSIAEPGTQIWVAQGTFFPVECKNCSPAERTISFQVPNDIQLYGGFAGTESYLSERNWKANPTQLSGNIGNEGPTDNSFSIIKLENASNNTIIDGFYIKDGQADAQGTPGEPSRSGAGIYNNCTIAGGISSPTIKNCVFMDNHAWEGAAIFNLSETGNAGATITNCSFVKNTADLVAGAVMDQVAQGKGFSKIEKCRFVGNEAKYGGAYFCNNVELGAEVFSNCHFINNQSEFGGAAFLLTGESNIQDWGVSNNFRLNKADKGNDFFFQKGFQIPNLIASASIGEDM